jgi:hypothetical protein
VLKFKLERSASAEHGSRSRTPSNLIACSGDILGYSNQADCLEELSEFSLLSVKASNPSMSSLVLSQPRQTRRPALVCRLSHHVNGGMTVASGR